MNRNQKMCREGGFESEGFFFSDRFPVFSVILPVLILLEKKGGTAVLNLMGFLFQFVFFKYFHLFVFVIF